VLPIIIFVFYITFSDIPKVKNISGLQRDTRKMFGLRRLCIERFPPVVKLTIIAHFSMFVKENSRAIFAPKRLTVLIIE